MCVCYFNSTSVWWTPTLYQEIQPPCMGCFVPSAGIDTTLWNPETWSPHLAMPLLWSERQKESSDQCLLPKGSLPKKTISISTWVVPIIYYQSLPFNGTPAMVLIIATEHPLYGNYSLSSCISLVRCEFHKEGNFAKGFISVHRMMWGI